MFGRWRLLFSVVSCASHDGICIKSQSVTFRFRRQHGPYLGIHNARKTQYYYHAGIKARKRRRDISLQNIPPHHVSRSGENEIFDAERRQHTVNLRQRRNDNAEERSGRGRRGEIIIFVRANK